MPIYEFQHPETGKTLEVIQGMGDKHIYVDNKGVEWKRVWNSPNASVDTAIDPSSQSDWMRCTAKKGMTIGDMWDLSKSLSKKREKSKGLDPIKNKTVCAYEKKTNKPHPHKGK